MISLARTSALATSAVLMAAGTASAHVQAFTSPNVDGTQALVQFTIPHGCDTAGTTKVEVNFPKEILSVTPISDATWTATGGSGGTGHGSPAASADEHADHSDAEHEEAVKAEADAKDAASDGTTVTWEATKPLPADDMGVLSAVVVFDPASHEEMTWLPTIQTCEDGEEYAWITKEAGAETPAVQLSLTAGGADSADHGDDDGDDAANDDTADEDSTDALTIVAFVLGALGFVLALAALAGARKK